MKADSSVYKILKLLYLLSGNRYYAKPELIDKLTISERTFFRYITSLRNFGFVIEQQDGTYHIPKNSQQFDGSIADLLHFSEEEAYILNEAINTIEASNKTRENLIGKLSALYDSDRIAVDFVSKEKSGKIKPLIEAIRQKKQVRLLNYQSSGSGKISDRLTEPFKFTPNYISLWTFEPASQTNKLFKISRIGRVEKLPTDWQFTDKHKANLTDCFRVGGKAWIPLKFGMSLKARNLLIEEYPLSEKMIQKRSDNDYLFDGHVAAFDGIARFMLGLPGEIYDIDNKDLKYFLKEKQKKSKLF